MNNLGNIIYDLRTTSKISRRKLSIMLNCSEMTIKRIENGSTKISDYMIEQINTIFDININEYYGILSKYNSYQTYLNCKHLKEAIDMHNHQMIEKYIFEFEHLDDFKSGEPYFLLCYCKIIVCPDLELSIKLCYSSLNVTNLYETLNKLGNIKLNDNIYAILIALTVKLEYLGNIQDAYILSEKLYIHFKTIIFENDYRMEKFNFDTQKKYITILNNYAHFCYLNKSYMKAISIADECIALCLTFNTLHALEYLFLLKMEVTYILGDIQTSLKYKNTFSVLCEVKNNFSLLDKINSKIYECYPDLIEI